MMEYLNGKFCSLLAVCLCTSQVIAFSFSCGLAHAEELGISALPGVKQSQTFLPPRQRDNDLSLVLGGTFYFPELDDHRFAPIGALFYKHRFDDIRVRSAISIFVNNLDVSKSGDHLDFLAGVDNRTYPFTTTETVDGKAVPGTALKWGTVNGRLGVGWRQGVDPFQYDNDLNVQLYYQLGYLYSNRVSETAPQVVLPPDTIVHGPLLKVRYDGLHRNRMELPDEGIAVGADAQYQVRGHWSSASYGGEPFSKAESQDYFKASGYFLVATDIPYLGEKNRIIARMDGGFTPFGVLDRFSAYRIGGGPITSDAYDLDRQVYPGAMFNQFAVYDYVITSLEYRREILPFLFGHLRGTFSNISRELFTVSGHGHYRTEPSYGGSAGVTSGFYGNSQLHIEYRYDTRNIRNGVTGSDIVLLWSKSF